MPSVLGYNSWFPNLKHKQDQIEYKKFTSQLEGADWAPVCSICMELIM